MAPITSPDQFFTYSAYGLNISSMLEMPEFVPGGTGRDARVCLRQITPFPTGPASPGGVVCATPETVYFHWPDVAAMMVHAGREIVVQPEAEAELPALRLFLIGPALGMLLHQRGLLVLHASAVELHGKAILFAGAPGWGKSTMAGALCRRGHALLCDDISPVMLTQGAPAIVPGFPQLKLWPDSAASLGHDPAALPALRNGYDKRAYRLSQRLPDGLVPLERVYILANGDEMCIERLRPQEGFIELLRHSYAARLVGPTGKTAAHFGQCSMLASTVQVSHLRHPRSLEMLEVMTDLIERDVLDGIV